ncbi:hypothetical protein CO670_17170 [Rhizobium sp. J15]|uniref:hypothetical protein n=1 Tax=Rhizobium sp. J15 TaxID=2035450 RepID=UPI000BEA8AE7|nr:hypothetical protein [Rhizobium sp. J15]PDT15507.1 hypothetical protein CO670_17170 [Rhizobium sp. J15]
MLDAASKGVFGGSRVEFILLEAAKQYCSEACIGMIRDNEGMARQGLCLIVSTSSRQTVLPVAIFKTQTDLKSRTKSFPTNTVCVG